MSNIVIEYQILLSNSEFRMSQRFRVDRDIFENGPRVDADLFYTDKKRCVFKKIRIRVDGASVKLEKDSLRILFDTEYK